MKKVFVNSEIFLSEGDYVIGGFKTEKTEDFKFADFYEALDGRISVLIDEYLVNATNFNVSLGIENPKETAHMQLSDMILDNLKIHPVNNDKTSIKNTIFSSFQMQKWLDDLRQNIKEFPISTAGRAGIPNLVMSVPKEQLRVVEQMTEDTSFEMFIEQLSLIES